MGIILGFTHSVGFRKYVALFQWVVLLHFMEHVFQMGQVYLLGWSRRDALGLLGMVYPTLVHSEWLHYGHALFMMVGLWLMYLSPLRRRVLMIAFSLAFYHHLEHATLLLQALFHTNLWGASKPVTFLQYWFMQQDNALKILGNRIELHFAYNLMVLSPTLTESLLKFLQRKGFSL